ncbi:DUF1801 domain-containing protein [Leucobacter sp. HY1908]
MSPSNVPPLQLIDGISGPRQTEARELLALFTALSGEDPVVWAGRIIGFGEYEYRYESGHRGTAPRFAFASNNRQHTIYLVSDFATRWPELVARLGASKTSKACLYLTRLTSVDRTALRELLERSAESPGG